MIEIWWPIGPFGSQPSRWYLGLSWRVLETLRSENGRK